jgi:hypothetical protein
MKNRTLAAPMGLIVLALCGCGSLLQPQVTDRSQTITGKPDRIVINIDVATREAVLNVAGPLAANRQQVKVQLIGRGRKENVNGTLYYYYQYPENIQMFPEQGSFGFAYVLAAEDKVKRVVLRTYWPLRDGRLQDSSISGDYDGGPDVRLPAEPIIFNEGQLVWKIGAMPSEQTVLVRTNVPGNVVIGRIYPDVTAIHARLEPTDKSDAWRLIVAPTATDLKLHCRVELHLEVDGVTHRATLPINVVP